MVHQVDRNQLPVVDRPQEVTRRKVKMRFGTFEERLPDVTRTRYRSDRNSIL